MDLVLEDDGQTEIYIGGEKFYSCKYVVLNLPADTLGDSMDEIIKNVPPENMIDENRVGPTVISPEEAFFVHCSNLQAWVDHDYDVRVLDSRLSFPILKKLASLGDLKAKRVFQGEVIERIYTDDVDRLIFLHREYLLHDLIDTEKEKYCNHLKGLLYRTLSLIDQKLLGRKKTLCFRDISVILLIRAELNGFKAIYDFCEGACPTTMLFDSIRDMLYIAFETGSVISIDWNTNKVIAVYENTSEDYYMPVLHLALSPDGNHLATANSCGDIVMYNTRSTGIELTIINRIDLSSFGHSESIGKIVFSRDGKHLFSFIITDQVKKIDIVTGNIISTIPPYDILVPKIFTVVSNDNKFLFKSGYYSERYIAWDVETGNHIFFTDVNVSSHKDCSFNFLSSKTVDGTKTVSMQENDVIFKDNTTGETFIILKFKDDKDDAQNIDQDRETSYFDVDYPVVPRFWPGDFSENLVFGFSPDGGKVMMWYFDIYTNEAISFLEWDVVTRKINIMDKSELSIKIDRNGLVAIIYGIYPFLFPAHEQRQDVPDLKRAGGHDDPVYDFLLNDDESLIATISGDKIITWDIKTGKTRNIIIEKDIHPVNSPNPNDLDGLMIEYNSKWLFFDSKTLKIKSASKDLVNKVDIYEIPYLRHDVSNSKYFTVTEGLPSCIVEIFIPEIKDHEIKEKIYEVIKKHCGEGGMEYAGLGTIVGIENIYPFCRQLEKEKRIEFIYDIERNEHAYSKKLRKIRVINRDC